MKKLAIIMAAALILSFSSAAFAEDGAALYKSKMCAACHGADGAGKTPLNTAKVQGMSDADLGKAITEAKPPMPSFKGKLTDDQVKALVAHIRTFKK